MFGLFTFHHSKWLLLASDFSLSFLRPDLIPSLQIKSSNCIGVECLYIRVWICFFSAGGTAELQRKVVLWSAVWLRFHLLWQVLFGNMKVFLFLGCLPGLMAVLLFRRGEVPGALASLREEDQPTMADSMEGWVSAEPCVPLIQPPVSTASGSDGQSNVPRAL